MKDQPNIGALDQASATVTKQLIPHFAAVYNAFRYEKGLDRDDALYMTEAYMRLSFEMSAEDRRRKRAAGHRVPCVGVRVAQEQVMGDPFSVFPICAGCLNAIDETVCWCGEGHGSLWIEHQFVPMGCDCYREKENEQTRISRRSNAGRGRPVAVWHGGAEAAGAEGGCA